MIPSRRADTPPPSNGRTTLQLAQPAAAGDQGGATAAVPRLLLTAAEAAQALAISARSLWALTAPRGPIPVVRVGPTGRGVRYRVLDLERWAAEQAEASRPSGEARHG